MVELNKIQKVVLLSGIILIVMMSLIPPWRSVDTNLDGIGSWDGGFLGYSFFLIMPEKNSRYGAEVDVKHLMVQYLVVVIITMGGVFLTAGVNSNPLDDLKAYLDETDNDSS